MKTTTMTVGERILAKMQALGLNQTQLAKKMGVSRTTVGYWISDTFTIRNDKIPRLAAILGVDPSALSPFGGGTVAPIDKSRKSNYIVLLSWSDLDLITAGNKMKMSSLKRPGYIEVDLDIPPDARALKIVDNSMESENGKSFNRGDLVIFDPNLEPTDGCYVLVRLRQTGEHLFRKYVQRRPKAYDLIALNPTEYPTVTVNPKFPAEIRGVLVEHREKFRPQR